MAVTIVGLATAGDGTDRATYPNSPATVTFPAGSLALTAIRSTQGTSADKPQTVVTAGLTWTELATIQLAAATARITCYGCVVGGTDITGTVVYDWTNGSNPTQTGAEWAVGYATGYRPGAAITDIVKVLLQATRTAQTGWNALDALAAFTDATNSATLGFFGHGANEATTPPTGWTELGDASHANPNAAFEWAYVATPDTTPDAAWSTSSAYGIIVLEILANVEGPQGHHSAMIRRRRRD